MFTDSQAPFFAIQAAARSRQIPPKKKISTACMGCKKRKTRCSGKFPCTQCMQRGTLSDCLIDSSMDLRRKGASERRIEELEGDRILLNAILEAIHVNDEQMQTLRSLISGNAHKADIAGYVDQLVHKSNECLSNQSRHPAAEPVRRHRLSGSIHDILNEGPGDAIDNRAPR